MSTGRQQGQGDHDLDVHRDHVISQEDFDDLNDRVRHYMDWSTNNMNYQTLKEVIQIPIVHNTSVDPRFTLSTSSISSVKHSSLRRKTKDSTSVNSKVSQVTLSNSWSGSMLA